ncbi:hypothetical protein F1559_001281 [Cyanidiococcus yangmingshanensis]|uniref:Uncharacterized protein n=1 Tax=Cyanidiococcus yangmingshanensis TaxID=2690220 RepID=A0A7J7IM16_9RHOD|nr:hypothetical protein F1559_001281 [Cyanidiococcus yangmingshanensis]
MDWTETRWEAVRQESAGQVSYPQRNADAIRLIDLFLLQGIDPARARRPENRALRQCYNGASCSCLSGASHPSASHIRTQRLFMSQSHECCISRFIAEKSTFLGAKNACGIPEALTRNA